MNIMGYTSTGVNFSVSFAKAVIKMEMEGKPVFFFLMPGRSCEYAFAIQIFSNCNCN